MEGAEEFQGQAALSTWLYRIAVNVSLNRVSGKKAETETLDLDRFVDTEAEQPGARLMREERAEAVRRAIGELPKKQRTTLILRTYHEMSHQEIAEILGSSVGAVKANFFHALANLKRILDQSHEPPPPRRIRRRHRRDARSGAPHASGRVRRVSCPSGPPLDAARHGARSEPASRRRFSGLALERISRRGRERRRPAAGVSMVPMAVLAPLGALAIVVLALVSAVPQGSGELWQAQLQIASKADLFEPIAAAEDVDASWDLMAALVDDVDFTAENGVAIRLVRRIGPRDTSHSGAGGTGAAAA